MRPVGGEVGRAPVRRIGAPVGGVVALLAVAGVAAAARRGSSPGTVHPLGLRILGDLAVGLAAAVVVLCVAICIELLVVSRRNWPWAHHALHRPPARTFWERLLMGLLAMVVLVAAALLIARLGFGDDTEAQRDDRGAAARPGSDTAATDAPGVDGLAVVAGVATAAGAVLALLVVERRRRLGRAGAAAIPALGVEADTPRSPRTETSALDEVTAAGLDELEREPDPRRAVVRAYHAMVTVLGAWGWPRQPSDTPFELLERALVGLGAAADPARRLTLLFERAKFSDHPVSGADKAEAITALRHLGREQVA